MGTFKHYFEIFRRFRRNLCTDLELILSVGAFHHGVFPCFSASCVSPLGLESGEIPDEALSHSLPASDQSKPQYIRLNGAVPSFPFGWYSRPYETPPDYLQIDFGSLRKVTRLSTMGGYDSHRYDRYVATYKLSHSKDGLTWVEYRENGQIKVGGLNLF